MDDDSAVCRNDKRGEVIGLDVEDGEEGVGVPRRARGVRSARG